MPHLTALGTPSPARRCDPRRIAVEGRVDVTTAIRRSWGLLAERYLHTISGECGRVSIALGGNGWQAVTESKAQPGVGWILAGPERFRARSGCSTAVLTVPEGNPAALGQVAAVRLIEDMAQSPATNGAERSVISMARPASADIGVAEVHDSITGAASISYEEGDFAEPAAVSAVTTPEGPVTDGR